MFFIDVKDVGARGDGVTDDSAAIQAALDTAPVGGIVGLSAGTYLITGPSGGNFLTIPSGVSLIGSGRGTVLMLGAVAGLSNALLNLNGNTDSSVQNLTIHGGTAGTQVQAAVFIQNNTRPVVKNIRIVNVFSGLGNLYIVQSAHGLFEDFEISARPNSTDHGFRIRNSVATRDYHRISGGWVEDGGFAYSAVCSNRNMWFNLIATRRPTTTTTLEGFQCDSCDENTFSQIGAFERQDNGFDEVFSQTVPGSPLSFRNTVRDSCFFNNKSIGLAIGSAWGIYENITCRGNGQGGTQRDGVNVSGSTIRAILRHVHSYDDQSVPTQANGINVLAGANQTKILGATFYGNTDHDILDAGTSTSVIP